MFSIYKNARMHRVTYKCAEFPAAPVFHFFSDVFLTSVHNTMSSRHRGSRKVSFSSPAQLSPVIFLKYKRFLRIKTIYRATM